MKKPKPHGRIIKMSQRLKRTRNATPRVIKALDSSWAEALEAMAHNRIGVNETYVLIIPQELMDAHGIPNIRSAARPLKTRIKELYKNKYYVQGLNTSEGPTIYISQPKTV